MFLFLIYIYKKSFVCYVCTYVCYVGKRGNLMISHSDFVNDFYLKKKTILNDGNQRRNLFLIKPCFFANKVVLP